MVLISHRGNINGINTEKENDPNYIDAALNRGFDVEIDIWYIDNAFYLGHDKPQHSITQDWLYRRKNKLWVHCKNVESLHKLSTKPIHYFWHENDTLTLTSKKVIWAYPGKQPIKNSIAVLPELNNDNVNKCLGVCSDFILKYLKI